MAHTQELTNAIAETDAWIDEFMTLIGWHDRNLSFAAFMGALHAFRDSLPWDEAATAAAYFPPLLRGLYFEGWHPTSSSLPLTKRDAVLGRIRDAVHQQPRVEPENVMRALFSLLAKRLPASELEDIKAVSPDELHALWPE